MKTKINLHSQEVITEIFSLDENRDAISIKLEGKENGLIRVNAFQGKDENYQRRNIPLVTVYHGDKCVYKNNFSHFINQISGNNNKNSLIDTINIVLNEMGLSSHYLKLDNAIILDNGTYVSKIYPSFVEIMQCGHTFDLSLILLSNNALDSILERLFLELNKKTS